MKPHEAYLSKLSHNDSWNNPARIEYLYGLMRDELDLKGKKVLDLGCRFGLYSYFALELGASYVVGVDIEPAIIEEAERAFVALDVDPETYCFSHNDVNNVDFMFYDVVLALGFFYNVPNQEFLLQVCRGAEATTLAEFWLDNNDVDYPVLNWLSGTKTEESGNMANQEVSYRQYLPNIKYVEAMFNRSGFDHKQCNEHSSGHCNVHFILKPNQQKPESARRWGMNNRVDNLVL